MIHTCSSSSDLTMDMSRDASKMRSAPEETFVARYRRHAHFPPFANSHYGTIQYTLLRDAQ